MKEVGIIKDMTSEPRNMRDDFRTPLFVSFSINMIPCRDLKIISLNREESSRLSVDPDIGQLGQLLGSA
jgi:hypothetical protein